MQNWHRRLPLAALVIGVLGSCDRATTSNTASDATQPLPHSSAAGKHTVRYRVTGMHCDGCANGIKALIAEMPGVISADASFSEGTATITTNDAALADAVRTAIIEMGYEVEVIDSDPPATTN